MALCPGLPGWASTKKEKPIWILLRQETVSGSGISWAICKSAPRSRQIPHQHLTAQCFTGRMPFLPPNQQRQSTEGKRNNSIKPIKFTKKAQRNQKLRWRHVISLIRSRVSAYLLIFCSQCVLARSLQQRWRDVLMETFEHCPGVSQCRQVRTNSIQKTLSVRGSADEGRCTLSEWVRCIGWDRYSKPRRSCRNIATRVPRTKGFYISSTISINIGRWVFIYHMNWLTMAMVVVFCLNSFKT